MENLYFQNSNLFDIFDPLTLYRSKNVQLHPWERKVNIWRDYCVDPSLGTENAVKTYPRDPLHPGYRPMYTGHRAPCHDCPISGFLPSKPETNFNWFVVRICFAPSQARSQLKTRWQLLMKSGEVGKGDNLQQPFSKTTPFYIILYRLPTVFCFWNSLLQRWVNQNYANDVGSPHTSIFQPICYHVYASVGVHHYSCGTPCRFN